MSDTMRSISVIHKKATNIRFQIGVHVPHQINDTEKPRVVIEIHNRDQAGVSSMIASLTLDEFTELARDVVSVGKSVAPSDEEAVS